MFANPLTYLQENIADVLIIVGAFLVLICSIFGYFVYLSYMSKDQVNQDRLLNVLYANLSYCFILNSGFLFLRFLQLKLFGINTFAFCLLQRCRQFLGPFTLLVVLQRSYTNLGVRSPFPSVFFYRAYSAPKLGALSGHLVIGQLRSHETNRRRVSDNNNTDC